MARITEENTRLLARLGDGERRFRILARGMVNVQEAERGRISRELHDGVGQSLTAIRIQLELLERQAGDPALRGRLADLRALAEAALQDVRQISHLLRPPILDELGLVPTLRWLARAFEQRTGVAVELDTRDVPERIEEGADTLVFRVVQEALANVAKHAGAGSARVRVRLQDGRVLASIEDAGSGFDADQALRAGEGQGGFGLRGMRDRVTLFGGRFAVRARPGAGTVVEVDVPLERAGA